MNITGNDVQGSIKEALYETLNEILSPERSIRQGAEQKIQALEVTEEFGIYLTEFVIDHNGQLAIRQLASVLLKQYVETHWTSIAEKFRPPEIKPVMKERIKEILPLGLKESISKIRTSVAYVISAIAYWDWPELWPGLFNILVKCLSGGDENAVHGAMRVLTEFTQDLTDTHLPQIGPIIIPEMFRIIQSENEYSIQVRARAVDIFTKIVKLVGSTDIYQKSFAQEYLEPVIPVFCEKFIHYLDQRNESNRNGGLKTEIVKSINYMILLLPKYIVPFLPQMLLPIWNNFIQNAKIYQEEYVNGQEHEDSKEEDSDGEIINFDSLLIETFDVIGTFLDHKKFANLLDDFLEDILYYLIIFMQVTDDQIELWNNNPNQFIEDEDNSTYLYNIRISAQELIVSVINYASEKGVNCLWRAITRHLEHAEQGGRNNNNWWKIHESSVYALNFAKELIIELHGTGALQFDILTFLNNVVLGILNDPGAHSLLLGRCLCLGGQYAKIMPAEMTSKFVEATVNGLQENQPICIRISAVKTIYSFCTVALSPEGNMQVRNVLKSHLPSIFEGLYMLAIPLSKEVLTLVIETFTPLILLDDDFTASIENKICPLTIAVLTKFHTDQFIAEICQNLFKGLTKNPNCVGPLHTRLVPILVNMMTIDTQDKSNIEECRSIALDTLRVLVRYSPLPLSNELVGNAFPAACHCILNSDDNGTLQSGGELIKSYLIVAPQQITEHRDNDGNTGLQYILKIIEQLLNPQSSEFTATFVGSLLITLVRKVGSLLGENLDLLLKGVLSKMQRTKTLTVMQSLIMVFAHLINTEFVAALNFLSTVPGPTGESALHFVLSEWVSRQHLFFGRYNRKVTTIALCTLLEYGVTQEDSMLGEINVKEEIIVSETEGVRTRSKAQAQPYMWTDVPVLVKILKLIINEISADFELIAASENIEDSDDEDSDDESLDPGNEPTYTGYNEDEENEEDDPELLQDSIYLLNLGQYLRDFLQNFSKHYRFSNFIQHLNNAECKILSKLNINSTYM